MEDLFRNTHVTLRGPIHPQPLPLHTCVPKTEVLTHTHTKFLLIALLPSLGLRFPLAKAWQMVLSNLQIGAQELPQEQMLGNTSTSVSSLFLLSASTCCGATPPQQIRGSSHTNGGSQSSAITSCRARLANLFPVFHYTSVLHPQAV